MQTIAEAAAALDAGARSRGLIEEALARINDKSGEGARTFLKVHAEQALTAADFYDRLRAGGAVPSRFAGIPVSLKDLFDIAGDVTTAGSRVLRAAPPAPRDAPAVARLRAAGFIPIGRTNMTAFAFSGIGINPHYGTPSSPYDRGSCRIPAGFCGIVGFKPTASRVPTQGAFPLSTTLDSVGPLAATVACCAALDAVLAGEPVEDLAPFPLDALRMAVPQTMVLDNVEPAVAHAFERALMRLRDKGARIVDLPLRELDELRGINAKGGIVTAEAYALHRPLIAKGEKMYDPRVLTRILRGREQDAADYIDLLNARADFTRRVSAIAARFDTLVMPTVPMPAPRMADLEPDDAYRRINMLVLRNPSIANFLDACSISIPCHRAGEAPAGLMLFGKHGSDRRLLSIAAAIENVVSPAVIAGPE